MGLLKKGIINFLVLGIILLAVVILFVFQSQLRTGATKFQQGLDYTQQKILPSATPSPVVNELSSNPKEQFGDITFRIPDGWMIESKYHDAFYLFLTESSQGNGMDPMITLEKYTANTDENEIYCDEKDKRDYYFDWDEVECLLINGKPVKKAKGYTEGGYINIQYDFVHKGFYYRFTLSMNVEIIENIQEKYSISFEWLLDSLEYL